MTEGLLKITPHIHMFNETHRQYFHKAALSLETDLQCEEMYYAFYQDIMKNRFAYFEVIFHMDDIYSERCVGMLSAYCKLLRRKGDMDQCLQVLQCTGDALQFYQNLSLGHPGSRRSRRAGRAQRQYCRQLTFHVNCIQIEVLAQQGIQQPAVQALRQAVLYELEEQFTFDQQQFMHILFNIVGPSYQDTSKAQLDAISDDRLWEALLTRSGCGVQSSGPTYEDDVRKCTGCHRLESARGEFEACTNCLQAVYCSYDCQKKHWKAHKRECGGGKENNHKWGKNKLSSLASLPSWLS